jgi:hypothetical protein
VITKRVKEWLSHLAIRFKKEKCRAKGMGKGNPKVDAIEMSYGDLKEVRSA